MGTIALASCVRPIPPPAPPATLGVQRARRGVSGVAVALVRRGAPDVFDASGDLGADTVLEVASLSKPVFALAVVSEAARGSIDLDAPLAKLAPPPYPHVRRGATDLLDDPRFAALTPRLLLSHRAGFPNWSRDRPLAFDSPPGERWAYSGEGYVLLQRVLERARREPLDAFARRAVFSPLGMAGSTFDPRGLRARASGHDRAGVPVDSSVDEPVAATSLFSSAVDYARFLRRLIEASPADPVANAMLGHEADTDAERRLSWGTGLGLAAPEWFFHWGANPGFRSLFVGSRARGEAVVVLTSSEGGMELAADIVRARFGDLPLLGYPMLYPPD